MPVCGKNPLDKSGGMWYNIFAPLNAELIWRSIEVVATRTTRNRFVGDEPARGFESLLLRQRVPRTQFRGEVLFLRFSPALHADSCRKHKRVPRPQFRGEALFYLRFSPAENALRLLHSQQRRYNKSSKVIFKLLHAEWAHNIPCAHHLFNSHQRLMRSARTTI